MKPLRLIEEAESEFLVSIDWYDEQEPGLGNRFRDHIQQCLSVIQSDPLRWRKISGTVRQYSVHDFPYIILYADRPSFILVYSIFHTSRDPRIWQQRTP